MITKNILIAGQSAGKRIYCTPAVHPFYDGLYKASLRGNHWARLTVLGIISLTSGHLGKKNIFVTHHSRFKDIPALDHYILTLPGCSATIEHPPADYYLISSLNVDLAYFEQQAQENKKPALYRARKINNEWKAGEILNGKVEKKDERLVAITDTSHSDEDNAANVISKSLASIPGQTPGNVFDKYGFDMHYTPGEKRLGGLVNLYTATRPLENDKANISAMTLARTMFHAKDTDNVQWVSEFGGSVVLTQAMKILVDRGVTLPKHMIFMHRPRSVPRQALKLAQQLGLKIGRDFTASAATDVVANMGKLGS